MKRSSTKQIEVVSYNPDWPRMFELEAAKIREVLGAGCLDIRHVGSTSVQGLIAKPAIDILCVVDDLTTSFQLQEISYVFRGEINIPLCYYFSNNASASRVNLHVVEADHGFIHLNLCFRDYLIAHEEARLAYAQLKESLLKEPKSYELVTKDFTGYNLGKNRFIKNILDKASFEDSIVNFCAHYDEWEAYHRICEEQLFTPAGVVYDRNHKSFIDNHCFLVLYKGTQIVSIGHVEFLNNKTAMLRSLATDKQHQYRGFGKSMLQFLEKWIKRQGRNVIKVHAILQAETFFRRFGYTEMIFNEPSSFRDGVNLGKVIY